MAKVQRIQILSMKGSFEDEQSEDSPSKTEPENYDVEDIVEKMLARKDRKIPGSVFKPHAETV